MIQAEALRRKGAHIPAVKRKPPSRPAACERSPSPRQMRIPPRATLRQDEFLDVEALAVERKDRLPLLSV